MEHKFVSFAADKALSRVLKYIDKAPEENLLKILKVAEKYFTMYPKQNYEKMRRAVGDKDNVYMQLAKNDPDYANGQYETDMSRERLYAEADRRLNGK